MDIKNCMVRKQNLLGRIDKVRTFLGGGGRGGGGGGGGGGHQKAYEKLYGGGGFRL